MIPELKEGENQSFIPFDRPHMGGRMNDGDLIPAALGEPMTKWSRYLANR